MSAAISRAELETMADELAELLASFPETCGLFPIRTKDAERGLVCFDESEWHPEQKRFEAERTGRDIILKSRQIGITTLELARDVWFARQHDGVQVLVVGHDPDLVEQTFLDAKRFAEALETLGLAPKPKYSTKRELVWPDTHSVLRIVEAGETEKPAKKKGRSGTIHRLHCTEVAFWGAADDTLTALTGALTKNAEVVIESTANGVGNRFHRDIVRAMAGELDGYKLHFWPWHLHTEYRREPEDGFDAAPRDEWEEKLRESGCDDQQLAWWRRTISDFGGGDDGLERALQEFPITPGAAFRAQGGQYVPAIACDRLDRGIRTPIEKRDIEGPDGQMFGQLWIYALPLVGRRYVVAADIADGGGCLSACAAIDRQSGEHCAVFASSTVEAGDFGHVLAKVGHLYGDALLAPERNNMGGTTIRVLEKEERYPHIYRAADGKRGWLTSPTSRPIMWSDLRRAIKDGEWSSPDARLVAEVRALVIGDDGKPHKGPGATDDLFTASAIGHQLRIRGQAHQADDDQRPGSEARRAMGNGTRARDLAY